ncbi:MAG TPA: LacI family transcriptional regulator [Firmicutes bacterium]|nr:LacI family transcriptional regulator [Bacillota bacterium]
MKQSKTKQIKTPPTIDILAQRAGVSPATVSLVLNNKGKVADDTRRHILKIAEELNYKPKRRRSAIPDHRRYIELLIEELPIPVFADGFCSEIIHGVETAANEMGFRLLLSVIRREDNKLELPPILNPDEILGLIVIGGGDLDDEYIKQLKDRGLPLILVDNYVEGEELNCVLSDNISGGYQATKHLIELGHRRIGMIRGPKKYKPLMERYQGYLLALHENGIPVQPELIPPRLSHGLRKGYDEMCALLDLPEPPTAVFVVSDKTAINALQAIKDRGLRVPQDIALVSFDDIAEAQIQNPPLTTVRVAKKEMGQLAVQKLLSLVRGDLSCASRTVLYTKLVIRESCGMHLSKTGRNNTRNGSGSSLELVARDNPSDDR